MNTPVPANPEDTYWTVSTEECRKRLGIGEKLFRRKVNDGTIPVIKLGAIRRCHMPTIFKKLQKGAL